MPAVPDNGVTADGLTLHLHNVPGGEGGRDLLVELFAHRARQDAHHHSLKGQCQEKSFQTEVGSRYQRCVGSEFSMCSMLL